MLTILEILTTTPDWQLIIIFGMSYLGILIALNHFLKKSYVNNFDPLRIQIIFFIAPYLTGYLVIPFFTGVVTTSFIIISFFIITWLLIIRMIGIPRQVNLRDAMRPEFQFLILTVAGLIIIANIVVNMIIPGKIPLFAESGVYGRFEATESNRLLTWLLFGSNNIGGLIFALTENKRIKRFALFIFILQLLNWLLFASKGVLYIILFILAFNIFIAQVRGDARRSKNLKRLLVKFSLVCLLLMPIYFNIIGFAGEEANYPVSIQLANRIFYGFDQLIPAALLDLAAHAEPVSLIGSNIIQYQFMPFMKAIFGMDFPYFSIGQYVLEAVTGNLITFAYTFPNSNLILETIFTSGYIVGFYIFLLELILFYSIRYMVLKMLVSPRGFFLLGLFIFYPVGLFFSGQEWCTNGALFGIIVFSCWVLSELYVEFRRLIRKNISVPISAKS